MVQKAKSLEELVVEIEQETKEAFGFERTEDTPSPVSTESSTYAHRQFIRFLLDDILLGVPLSGTLEIGHLPAIAPLPNLPRWVMGISNIRGEIVSIVDLKGFLGLPSKRPSKENRLIIVHNGEMKVGMMVGKIMGILSLDRIAKNVQPSPFEEGEISSFILGIVVYGEETLHILDVDKLLSSPRMTGFRPE